MRDEEARDTGEAHHRDHHVEEHEENVGRAGLRDLWTFDVSVRTTMP